MTQNPYLNLDPTLKRFLRIGHLSPGEVKLVEQALAAQQPLPQPPDGRP